MPTKNPFRGELLVALLKEKSDFAILQEQGWYRIPVASRPRSWPPNWLAFYQPNAFGEDAYRIRYFGEISRIQIVKRSELFPNELLSHLSEKEYFQIYIKQLEERVVPIPSYRPRRLVFIPTTLQKFHLADQINDLFDDSPLEDRLWQQFKSETIGAERQWCVLTKQQYYFLDFALFCNRGQINIETDGDRWHADVKQIPLDNQRDNDLQASGWHVLRFNGQQINEQMYPYCLGNIYEMINLLGGISEDSLVPRIFFTYDGKIGLQPPLFEKPINEYETGEAQPTELD